MRPRNKYHLMRVTQSVSVLAAGFGLLKMARGATALGAIILFASALIGFTASIFGKYYDARQDDVTRSQKVALDALAQVANRQEKDRKQKRY